MDEVLIQIMRILAAHSLPYLLHGSEIHIGRYLLQVSDPEEGRLALNGSEMVLNEFVEWIGHQSLETVI
ncbi:hypothetical protein [Paenibacillus woosongensis]|uniref:Uncharacterized protein n=1 Tax=Paenibacillus woosongensis TaxID=307580 RepID=A0ABQ4MSZ4_9BACL|nr:hypothetical protein [Paenibacillus woosongensis]GIP58690.1 hypothetical protein J15TS10_25040 [Paenibacillus woosongensis]